MVKEKGMSLIEVTVALLVATIGILGMLALVGVVMKGGDFSRAMTEATTIAQTYVNQLTAVSKTNFLTQCTTINNSGTGTSVYRNSVAGSNTGQLYTVNCAVVGWQSMNNVQVTVSWYDAANKQHFVYAQKARAP